MKEFNIKITAKSNDEIVQIKVEGKITIESVSIFEETVYEVINKDIKKIKINFQKLTYIDSSGIGALIKAVNVCKKSSIEMVLTNVSAEILKLFKTGYIENFFTIENN